jgi:phosphoribosylanthranilate isomerase
MFVKVCGITRLQDALLAAELGASAVGFVLWPGSARFVEPARARSIVARLPPGVLRVGVFVNQPVQQVNDLADAVGLGAVQLHGEEPAGYCESIERPIIKAIAVGDSFDAAILSLVPASATLLLDACDPIRRGGTGTTVDWRVAAGIARQRQTVLAGGLNPGNVAAAIRGVAPYGVDVSSGVESAPGVKDDALVRAFFEALNGAAAGR